MRRGRKKKKRKKDGKKSLSGTPEGMRRGRGRE